MVTEKQSSNLRNISPAILMGAGASIMMGQMIMEHRINAMNRCKITLAMSYLNYLKTVYTNLHWWQIISKARIKRKIKEQKLELNKLYEES